MNITAPAPPSPPNRPCRRRGLPACILLSFVVLALIYSRRTIQMHWWAFALEHFSTPAGQAYYFDQLAAAGPPAYPLLEKMLHHDSELIAQQAVNTLARAEDLQAWKLLDKVARNHPSPLVRAQAIEHFGANHCLYAFPVILEALDDDATFTQPTYYQQMANWVIQQWPTDTATQPNSQPQSSGGRVCQFAAHSLEQLSGIPASENRMDNETACPYDRARWNKWFLENNPFP